MTIQQLDDTRVIIALCREDMELLSLKYSTLGFKDTHSRCVLKKLISVAGSKTGIAVNNHSVYIEALPYNKGCLLVVTLLPKGSIPKRYRIKKSQNQTVFTFDTAENLLCCAKQLYKRNHSLESSAYSKSGKYYLSINITKDVPEDAVHIMREYAQKESRDKLFISAVTEHGKCIANNNAILLIGSAMH